jgi:hypothetical protein
VLGRSAEADVRRRAIHEFACRNRLWPTKLVDGRTKMLWRSAAAALAILSVVED